MRILVDIGHPGHVHLFRNLIKNMASKGHEFLVTSRDKEVSLHLLRAYGIPFYNRGKGYKGLTGKILGTVKITGDIMAQARKFKPDILLGGVGNIYIALAAFFLRKPSVICDDTEHAALELAVVKRFATHILTPAAYRSDLGPHQVRYPAYHEWAYLNPRYFKPSENPGKHLGLNASEKYVIIRLVSWEAGHDFAKKGLSLDEKVQLLKTVKKYARPFISAEGELPAELGEYRMQVAPELIHDVLAGAELFIGEGATMASESVCAGTPAIYSNPLEVGYCSDLAGQRLLYHITGLSGMIAQTEKILSNPDFRSGFRKHHQEVFSRMIDLTAFLEWTLTGYPASFETLRKYPGTMNQFLPSEHGT